MAQWITRLTTDQKIPGSNPGKIGFSYRISYIFNSLSVASCVHSSGAAYLYQI